jgi:hypothetical protein
MEAHIEFSGILLILLAFLHVGFSQYFNWKKELKKVSLINKEMMVIHTLFLAIVLLLMGVMCFTSAYELTNTKLGKKIAMGMAIFWGLRLYIQFFGYSSSHWKGKRLETIIHILFSVLWTYFTCIWLCIVYK